MEMHRMTRPEVRETYRKRMLKDFPWNERRPLSAILKARSSGIYECYGMTKDGEFGGYAFFAKSGSDYLLDYLATAESRRGEGLGAEFLGLMAHRLADAESFIAEVEDPELAENPEEKVMQERRLNFYLRNGFADTGVRSRIFGVDYKLIELPLKRLHTREEIVAKYSAVYRLTLPEKLYDKLVEIK